MERSVRLNHPVHLCEGLNNKTSHQGSLLPKVHKDTNILGPAAPTFWATQWYARGGGALGHIRGNGALGRV